MISGMSSENQCENTNCQDSSQFANVVFKIENHSPEILTNDINENFLKRTSASEERETFFINELKYNESNFDKENHSNNGIHYKENISEFLDDDPLINTKLSADFSDDIISEFLIFNKKTKLNTPLTCNRLEEVSSVPKTERKRKLAELNSDHKIYPKRKPKVTISTKNRRSYLNTSQSHRITRAAKPRTTIGSKTLNANLSKPAIERPRIVLKFLRSPSGYYQCFDPYSLQNSSIEAIRSKFETKDCWVVIEKLQITNLLESLKQTPNTTGQFHSDSTDPNEFSVNRDFNENHIKLNNEDPKDQLNPLFENQVSSTMNEETMSDADNGSMTSELSLFASSLSDFSSSPDRDGDFNENVNKQTDAQNTSRLTQPFLTIKAVGHILELTDTNAMVEEILSLTVRNQPKMLSPIRDLDLSLTTENRKIIYKSDGTDQKTPVADIAPSKNESSASTKTVSSHTLAESNSKNCSTHPFMPQKIKMVSPIRDLDLSLTNERRNIINKSGGTDPKLPVADIAPLKNESSASTEPVSHKLAESNSNKCSTFMPRVIINTVESSSQSQDLRQRLSKTQVVTRNVGEGVASQQSGYSTQHSETSAADAYSIEKNRFYPALKLFNHPCLKFLQELPVCQQNRCRYNHELPACDVILGKMLKFTNEVICNIYDGFIKKTRLTFTRYFLVMCQIYVNRRIVPSLERLVSDCEHYKSYNFLETIFNAMSACGINASDSLMLILKNCDICSASESIIKIVRDNPP
ncbi:hypothetical protein Bhyg_10536, partial [Pseudolycoriella hygida]